MNPVNIAEPAVLIRINKAFKPHMTDVELYHATRGRWRVNVTRARKAKYAFIIYKGVVKEVYEIEDWQPATADSGLKHERNFEGRWEFNRKSNPNPLSEKYKGKLVGHYFVKGNSNPINYINLNS